MFTQHYQFCPIQNQGHVQAQTAHITMWVGLCTSAPDYCGVGNQNQGVDQPQNYQGTNQGHSPVQGALGGFTQGCMHSRWPNACQNQGVAQPQNYQGAHQGHSPVQGALGGFTQGCMHSRWPNACQNQGVAQPQNYQGTNQGHSPVQGALGGFTQGCMHSIWPNACMNYGNQTDIAQNQHIAQNHFDGNIYQNQIQQLGFTGLFCDPTMGCLTSENCPQTMTYCGRC